MAVLKNDSTLPPLPGGIAPNPLPAPPRQPEPAAPSSPAQATDSPPGIDVHRVSKVIDNPAAVLGVGPIGPKKRRIVSRWEKTKYVIRPTVVDPIKVGALGTVGFIAVGALYGAATTATIGAGMIGGYVVAGFVLPPVVGVVAAVGVVRSISRMFTSRAALTERIEKRRQKSVLKEHGIVSKKKKKRGFRS